MAGWRHGSSVRSAADYWGARAESLGAQLCDFRRMEVIARTILADHAEELGIPIFGPKYAGSPKHADMWFPHELEAD